jgi:formylglycine-generating enzyme required for sulfatase activity
MDGRLSRACRALFCLGGCALLWTCSKMDLRDEIVKIVQDTTAPASPTNLSVTSVSDTTISLRWQDNAGTESGYQIEERSSPSEVFTVVHTTTADVTSWQFAAAAPSVSYSFRVCARGSAANSGFSNVVTALTSFTPMVSIRAAGDAFVMGDATVGVTPAILQSISYDYLMASHLVTNGEFIQFIGDSGYGTASYWTTTGWGWNNNTLTQPDDHFWTDPRFSGVSQPVVGISWYEAVAFCNWRSIKDGLTPCYDSAGRADLSATGYRLPTEVEWEYAAAKGGVGQAERVWAWGDAWDSSKSVYTAASTAAVGSKSPAGDTPQGLTDMSGNAWELCSDNWIADNAVTTSEVNRYFFLNDSGGLDVCIRGGTYLANDPNILRCACRAHWNTYTRYTVDLNAISFRVVRRLK